VDRWATQPSSCDGVVSWIEDDVWGEWCGAGGGPGVVPQLSGDDPFDGEFYGDFLSFVLSLDFLSGNIVSGLAKDGSGERKCDLETRFDGHWSLRARI
jgi:hypothetical protein